MIAQVVAGAARLFAGCQARWLEPPPTPGPRVYYANHTSHLDALVIWASLPSTLRRNCRMIAAADYWEQTALRRWMARDLFRAALIHRTQVTRATNPLDVLLAVLDAGDAMIIFPEGSRGAGDELQDLRAGLWHLARKRPATPFTPVWLENLSRVLPKGEFLPVPVLTAVTFGAELRFEVGQSKSGFMELLRARLRALSGDGP